MNHKATLENTGYTSILQLEHDSNNTASQTQKPLK